MIGEGQRKERSEELGIQEQSGENSKAKDVAGGSGRNAEARSWTAHAKNDVSQSCAPLA